MASKTHLLNYVDPTYEFIETPDGTCKVDVRFKVGEGDEKNIPAMRRKILFREAAKSSLFAMAFIQKLATDGDSQAKALRSIYRAYIRFLDTGDKSHLQQCCQALEHHADGVVQGCIRYLASALAGTPVAPELRASQDLLNKLIPNIGQAVSCQLPHKVYDEQEVTVPESQAQHKAFPDIVKHEGHYYVCFREAFSHIGFKDLGSIRIVRGECDPRTFQWTWTNVAFLTKEGIDLRDPRFFVTTDNTLKIIMGGTVVDENNETTSMVPHVASFEKGKWSIVEAIVDPAAKGPNGQWIWRVTWNEFDQKGYGFSYGAGSTLDLMQTSDGLHFKKIATIDCRPLNNLSEATIRFKSDGTAIALIRSRRHGIIGQATPKNGYKTWLLSIVPFRIGGPNFVVTQEKMWAATRYYFLHEDNMLDDSTIISLMDEITLIPVLRLKSGIDTSYPGMVLEADGSATIVYYARELDKESRIFITRITLPC